MSRRSKLWLKKLRQAGGGSGVDKILPRNVTGEGVYLTKGTVEGLKTPPKPGQGRGNQVSVGMNAETETRIRKIAATLK